MARRYVWLVEDEKYGTQAVFATKRMAQHAIANDASLYVSGGSVVAVKMLVREGE